MPARPGGDSAAGRGGPRASSAAAISGRGRKTRTLRSAPAGASPPASLSSTTLPPKDTDTRPDHGRAALQIILALTGPVNGIRPARHAAIYGSETRTHGSAEESALS